MSNYYDDLIRLNDENLNDAIEMDIEKKQIEYSIYRTKNICENNQEIINSIENDF